MELDDMSLGVQEVTVISENAGGIAVDAEAEMYARLNNMTIASSVTSPPSKKCKGGAEKTGMQVDQNADEKLQLSSASFKTTTMNEIQRMSREELEKLVLTKTIEGISKHLQVGKFRTRMFEIQNCDEQLEKRVAHLTQQVHRIGSAIKILAASKDPNNLNRDKKPPPSIQGYRRSVGLQVQQVEPPVNKGMSKAIHVNHVNSVLQNGVKLLNGTIPFKKPGPKSRTIPRAITNNKNNVGPRKVANQMNGHHSPTEAVASITTTPSKSIFLPTVVDLTDGTVVSGRRPSGGNSGVFRLGKNDAPGGYLLRSNAQSRETLGAPNVSTASTKMSTGRPVSVVSRPALIKTASATNLSTGRPAPVFARPVLNKKPIQIQPRAPPRLGPPIRPAAIIPPRPQSQQQVAESKKHLPPLPASPVNFPRNRVLKEPRPPRPILTLTKEPDGIVLSWTLQLLQKHEEIASYQIYGCQEKLASGKTSGWKKVGEVKAMQLPMACTLTKVCVDEVRYFFIVRAIDRRGRAGAFCEPGQIVKRMNN